MTCCFTGHRIIDVDVEQLKQKLSLTIDELILQGATRFISGGALGFDTIAAEVIIEKKQEKDIFLEIAVPCLGQESRWNNAQKERYKNILDNANAVTVLSKKYITGCMHARNKYMVDKSQVVISYYRGRSGGTQQTFLYAQEMNKRIINM